MAEEAVKKKINDAIDLLIKQYPDKLYKTIKLKDASCPFHLEVFRDEESDPKANEVFKFRVVLGEITETDKKLCREYKLPGGVFTKVIACKTDKRGEFEYFTISSLRK